MPDTTYFDLRDARKKREANDKRIRNKLKAKNIAEYSLDTWIRLKDTTYYEEVKHRINHNYPDTSQT